MSLSETVFATCATINPLVLDVREAAKALSLGSSTVRSLIDKGQLPTITVGDRRLITFQALQDFVAQRIKASAS